MDPIRISDIIRSDFGAITDFKWRGDELEVITPFAMANRDLVSVFVRQRRPGFFCRVELDMGRLRPKQKRKREELMELNGIRHLTQFVYEKIVYSPQVISSAILDLAEFAVACSWLFGVKPGDET